MNVSYDDAVDESGEIKTLYTMRRMFADEEEESGSIFATFLVIHWFLTKRLKCELYGHKEGSRRKNPTDPDLVAVYCGHCNMMFKVEDA